MALADQKSDAADYLSTGRAILANLETAQPNYPAIASSVSQMLEHAKSVAIAFGDTYTQCAPQVARMVEGALGLPQAEGCYAVRDIIAHPAITRALANRANPAPQAAQLRREMAEGVEHMEEIVRALGLE